MIESNLKKDVLKFLESKKGVLNEEEKNKTESTLDDIEKDLNNEFEKLVDRFKSKVSDVDGAISKYKSEIIKKAMENLVKSL